MHNSDFIEVHVRYNDAPMMINTKYIRQIIQNDVGNACLFIETDDKGKNYYTLKESYNEILMMLMPMRALQKSNFDLKNSSTASNLIESLFNSVQDFHTLNTITTDSEKGNIEIY